MLCSHHLKILNNYIFQLVFISEVQLQMKCIDQSGNSGHHAYCAAGLDTRHVHTHTQSEAQGSLEDCLHQNLSPE